MLIYMIVFTIVITPVVYLSILHTTDDNIYKNNIIFYFLVSLILIYSLPLFFFMYTNYVLSTLVMLGILISICINSFYLYLLNKKNIYFILPMNIFNYFTFCYLLAINLMNR